MWIALAITAYCLTLGVAQGPDLPIPLVAACSYMYDGYSLSFSVDSSSMVNFNLTFHNAPAGNFWTGVGFGEAALTGLDVIVVEVLNGQVQISEASSRNGNVSPMGPSGSVRSLGGTVSNQVLQAFFARPLSGGYPGAANIDGCMTWSFFVGACEIDLAGNLQPPTQLPMTQRYCDIRQHCPTPGSVGGVAAYGNSLSPGNQGAGGYQQTFAPQQDQPGYTSLGTGSGCNPCSQGFQVGTPGNSFPSLGPGAGGYQQQNFGPQQFGQQLSGSANYNQGFNGPQQAPFYNQPQSPNVGYGMQQSPYLYNQPGISGNPGNFYNQPSQANFGNYGNQPYSKSTSQPSYLSVPPFSQPNASYGNAQGYGSGYGSTLSTSQPPYTYPNNNSTGVGGSGYGNQPNIQTNNSPQDQNRYDYQDQGVYGTPATTASPYTYSNNNNTVVGGYGSAQSPSDANSGYDSSNANTSNQRNNSKKRRRRKRQCTVCNPGIGGLSTGTSYYGNTYSTPYTQPYTQTTVSPFTTYSPTSFSSGYQQSGVPGQQGFYDQHGNNNFYTPNNNNNFYTTPSLNNNPYTSTPSPNFYTPVLSNDQQNTINYQDIQQRYGNGGGYGNQGVTGYPIQYYTAGPAFQGQAFQGGSPSASQIFNQPNTYPQQIQFQNANQAQPVGVDFYWPYLTTFGGGSNYASGAVANFYTPNGNFPIIPPSGGTGYYNPPGSPQYAAQQQRGYGNGGYAQNLNQGYPGGGTSYYNPSGSPQYAAQQQQGYGNGGYAQNLNQGYQQQGYQNYQTNNGYGYSTQSPFLTTAYGGQTSYASTFGPQYDAQQAAVQQQQQQNAIALQNFRDPGCTQPDPYFCEDYVRQFLEWQTKYNGQSLQAACGPLIASLQNANNRCCQSVRQAGCSQ